MTLWMVRAGRHGEREQEAIEKGFVAILSAKYGLLFPDDEKMIENGEWYALDGVRFCWKDIQLHFRPDQDLPHSEAKDLISWLVTINLETLKPKPKRAIFPTFRGLYLKYILYQLYKISKIISTKIRS